MNRAYVGIDLGTSSVKVLLKHEDGKTVKARESYEEISPKGWFCAVIKALSSVEYPENVAIGLSSQVGTYIVNEKDVINWSCSIGADETDEIRKKFSNRKFIREISMPHPRITSYPIPRLKYIEKTYGKGAMVCQPKDVIGKMLTGNYKTDKFSWRGLANTEKGVYSKFFLKKVGSPNLPEIIDYTERLGYVSDDVCKITGIPVGTPVYIGLNDFFASLVGMGIKNAGDMFDITGTSEHLGIITDSIDKKTSMVSGPFTENFVHYGVTASSGASLDFAISNFGIDGINPDEESIKNAPIFLPYLNGERAPIFDSNASGTFVGVNGKCTKNHMAYAVLEGVVFSIYHIYEHLGAPLGTSLTVSGGASKNDFLNYLKAEMFNLPVKILEESDTSALGALIIAANASGETSDFCRTKQIISPDGKLKPILEQRFKIYKDLYPILKNTFKEFKEVHK